MKNKMLLIVVLLSALFLLAGCGDARFLDCIDGCSSAPQGPKGDKGESGLSCTVIETTTGATIACEDGTVAQVTNGSDGIDGTNGVDGQDGTIVEMIELCPHKSGGVFKEYALRIGGDLFAVYASGEKIGMAKLWPGEWQTTDGRECKFTVNNDLTISY